METRISHKRGSCPAGLTLVEVIVALTFGLVMILGTLGFTYYSRFDAHKANVQITAARISSALLESWKANGGRDSYNPASVFGDEIDIYDIPQGPAGFADALGPYRIPYNDVTYYASLSYQDAVAGGPKMLNVVVAWTEDRGEWTNSDYQKMVRQTAYMQNF